MDNLVIALPTGRIGKQIIPMLRKNGITSALENISRKLEIIDTESGFKFMFLKPADIITYVEKGVADIGFVGKDSLLEEDQDVLELFDLEIGKCQFVVAGYQGTDLSGREEALRVATKYPKVASRYFKTKNQEIEIIKLNGSVEIAPLVDLSDVIVDITETGTTLRENGLSVLEEMTDISTRLISNRVSYQFLKERINKLINSLKEWIQWKY